MENVYWHLQMYLPYGRGGETIDSVKMLKEPRPVIGTGEWNDLQCHYFKNSTPECMQPGDIVLVREGQKALALCRIVGPAFTDAALEAKYFHRWYRHVEVLEFYNGKEPFSQAQGTLRKLSNPQTSSWQFIEQWHKKILLKMKTAQITDIIKQKKQIILQGAPGTGKTYATAALALSLIGEPYNPLNHQEIMEKYDRLVNEKRIFFTTFHQSMDYEDFVEGLKPVVTDGRMTYEVKDGIFKTACRTAEQKGSLDEFDKAIEKLKQDCSDNPITAKTAKGVDFSVSYREGRTFRVRSHKSKAEEGRDFPANIDAIRDYYQGKRDGIYNISYVRGICEYIKQAYGVDDYLPAKKDMNYVFIIDEINRGNISKIFGELITLLEADKRIGGEHPIKARLAYSNDENFGVPSNLYIIGTMNTTDRSVGHIDYAIRRRFAFYTLTADRDALESYYDTAKNIKKGTKEIALNLFDAVIAFVDKHKSPEFDTDDIMAGHSYFMAEDNDSLKHKLDYEIIPLLYEYEKDGLITLTPDQRKDLGRDWHAIFNNAK